MPSIPRLLGSIDERISPGGEYGPVNAAVLLVADKQSCPFVEYSDEPGKAPSLWDLNQPQVVHIVKQDLRPREIPASRF